MGKELPKARLWVMKGDMVITCGDVSLWKHYFISQHGRIKLSHLQKLILEHALLSPRAPRRDMIEYVYPDAEISPDNESNTLSVHLGILRRHMETIGYTLGCHRGRGMTMFGVWIEELDSFVYREAWQRQFQERMHRDGYGKFIRAKAQVDVGVG